MSVETPTSVTGTRLFETQIHERGVEPIDCGTHIIFHESWLTADAMPEQKSAASFRAHTEFHEISFLTAAGDDAPPDILRIRLRHDQPLQLNDASAFVDYERAMLLLSLNSATGLERAYHVLRTGKTLCFAPPGATMLRLLNLYGINTVFSSMTQALALAELQEKMTRYPLAALKSLRISDSAFAPEDMRRIKNNLCHKVIADYSAQETGFIATAPHDMIADLADAVGFVVPQAEVQIVDAEDQVLSNNVGGLVRVRTPQFLANFDITDTTTWFYTGHKGRLTDDGILCITGSEIASSTGITTENTVAPG